ncbi:acylphosphatase [bacterium]|nr:acylphosphatase [bacterium]
MKKCLKIRVSGTVQGVAYRAYAQKHAQTLGIEGTVQNAEDGSVVIYACGPAASLERFIDFLYKGTPAAHVEDLLAEPFVNERDYRSVFRIIGD